MRAITVRTSVVTQKEYKSIFFKILIFKSFENTAYTIIHTLNHCRVCLSEIVFNLWKLVQIFLGRLHRSMRCGIRQEHKERILAVFFYVFYCVISARLHEIILFSWYRQLWPVSSA